MDLTGIPYEKSVKHCCGRCEGFYSPKSSRHGSIDSAYFGTTLPHLLLVYPALISLKDGEVPSNLICYVFLSKNVSNILGPWPPNGTGLATARVNRASCPISRNRVCDTELRCWGGSRKPDFLWCNIWWECVPQIPEDQIRLSRGGPRFTLSRNQPDHVEGNTARKKCYLLPTAVAQLQARGYDDDDLANCKELL